MKTALIIGSLGQDGQLLSAYLKSINYRVIGVDNRSSSSTQIDLTSLADVSELISSVVPDEIYYLAAYHRSSEERANVFPIELAKSLDVHVTGLANILEAIRRSSQNTRVFYASSCLIFEGSSESPQTEETKAEPRSPYGITKFTGQLICRYYREKYSVFAASGILYNHESSLRPLTYISQKIIHGALRVKAGLDANVKVGDLNSVVDWGYAPEYVQAAWLMLQRDTPDDFIVATGTGHTVKEMAEFVFRSLGLDWERYVSVEPSLIHTRATALVGNPEKIVSLTGWKANTNFDEMLEKMIADQVNIYTESVLEF